MNDFKFPDGLRVVNMADVGLSHIYICENGQMYDTRKGCEIFPQKRFSRVELRSYDLDIDRLRFSLDHLLGYFFRAPWRQFIVPVYVNASSLGLSKYYVLRDGRVFSTYTWGYMKGTVNEDGYVRMLFTYDDGHSCAESLHIIVAKLYLPNPEGKNEVNHINCNKLDNSVDNLEWVWSWENIKHAREHGLRACAITDEEIHTVCQLLEQGYGNTEISRRTGIALHLIKEIKAGCHMRISSHYNIPRTKHYNLKPSNNPTGAERTRLSTYSADMA